MQNAITSFISSKDVSEYLNCSESSANQIINSLNNIFVKEVSRMIKKENKKKKCIDESVWTLEEYNSFIQELKSEPIYYYAFQLLYWCGLRAGELLALTAADIDLSEKTIRINKSYQRSVAGYCIKTPLTPNGIRTVNIPDALIYELNEYINNCQCIDINERLFPITQEALSRKIKKVSEMANLKQTTLAGIRHSYVINGGKL